MNYAQKHYLYYTYNKATSNQLIYFAIRKFSFFMESIKQYNYNQYFIN